MSNLPTGTITFLFTDIEGSTRLWETQTQAMAAALRRHDVLLRQLIETHHGYVFKTVGDAFCAAFPTANDGLEASLGIQLALAAETWPVPGGIRVRMGLHTGIAEIRDNDYFGQTLNRAARLQGIGHGGQLLVSLVTEELLRDHLPENVGLKDIGEHRLKDLMHPERVFQVTHPGLGTEFPPVKSLDAHPHNLPVQPTPFLGREKELAALKERLGDAAGRVLTLLGPGGTGKTRLALQAAADAAERFDEGVWFVDLSSVDSPLYLFPVIVRTLGLKEKAGAALDTLKDFFSHRSMLLILDNFEQIRGGHPYVIQLLEACPSLTLVVTSREALRIRGEQVFPVPPLPVPSRRVARTLEPAQLSQYDAVTLFLERARAARPDFSVSDANAPAIAEICARLDGLPLAIELAAARTALLEPGQILERLGRQLGLLTGGLADLPPRQRTLRAAIEWSYRLLDDEEKTLMEELSYFRGGASLEALEGVCTAPHHRSSMLELLDDLVSKSLIRRSAADTVAHFSQLEAIREHCGELAEQRGLTATVRDAHARFFLGQAERLNAQIWGPARKAVLDELDADLDNHAEALDWLHEQGRFSDQLWLACSLAEFWKARGHLTSGIRELKRALVSLPAEGGPTRAHALTLLASLLVEHGEPEEACERLESLPAQVRNALPLSLQAFLWLQVSNARYHLEQLDTAQEAIYRAISVAHDGGAVLAARIKLSEGRLALVSRSQPEARTCYEQALRLAHAAGSPALQSRAESSLGIIAMYSGDLASARTHLQRSLVVLEALEERTELVVTLNNLAEVERRSRNPDAAASLFRRMAALARHQGNPKWQIWAHCGLVECLAVSGDVDQAETASKELELWTGRWGHRLEQGLVHRATATLAEAQGRLAEALAQFQNAADSLEGLGMEEERQVALHAIDRITLDLSGRSK